MRVELLGTMHVHVDGEPLPKVRSRKAKWLLALLALRGGKPVGRATVARTLWPDTEPAVALTNLRSVISDLRKALGNHAGRLGTPDRRTLSFDFDEVVIDVLEFDAAIKDRDLERAVELYSGPLLRDCEEEWVGPERGNRERACLAAYHELAQTVEVERAIRLSQEAIGLAPWQDGPRRDLMAAFVRANDINAALLAYREFADALRAETGGIPDSETMELYVRLRTGVVSSGQPEPTVGALCRMPSVHSSAGKTNESRWSRRSVRTGSLR